MFAVTITFSLRLGEQAAFMKLLDAYVRETVADETGCSRAEAFGDPTRPGKVMLVQFFGEAEDFEGFRASPVAQRFDSAVVDMVMSRSIATWSEVISVSRG